MNILVYTLISILSIFNFSDNNEIEKSVLNALKNGNAKELSTFFTSSLKVSIHNEQQIANKSQAELIVSDYFNNNVLIEVKRSEHHNEKTKNCLIYDVKTSKKQVRVFMKIVNLRNKDYISEFRVE